MLQSTRSSRRDFLAGALSAGAGILICSRRTAFGYEANERLNIAAIGVGGKGWVDLNGAAEGNNVVAYCDVDQRSKTGRRGGYAATAKEWPNAVGYQDWRVMLDREHKQLDAVTISTRPPRPNRLDCSPCRRNPTRFFAA